MGLTRVDAVQRGKRGQDKSDNCSGGKQSERSPMIGHAGAPRLKPIQLRSWILGSSSADCRAERGSQPNTARLIGEGAPSCVWRPLRQRAWGLNHP
jgi:hypothetical protein